MPWSQVLEVWQNLFERLCADFPHLDELALRRFRGNRDLLVNYLAETHELTQSEADECLRDWFDFRALAQ